MELEAYGHDKISIHALREEGDGVGSDSGKTGRQISIHALREEGDAVQRVQRTGNRNFYPRPPRGGRRSMFTPLSPVMVISIHALREEGDAVASRLFESQQKFLSTPSARRATPCLRRFLRSWLFLSTPSARRATWGLDLRYFYCGEYFYPRPPRGGRPRAKRARTRIYLFLSTPSARRATSLTGNGREPEYISIHALREEGDRTSYRN